MRDELSVLSAFMTVAEERSFTRAAKRLNISTSGLSHAIRRLEEQIGVRLLTRTTRSVAPTDAGEQLLAQLRPALGDIRTTLTNLSGLRIAARQLRGERVGHTLQPTALVHEVYLRLIDQRHVDWRDRAHFFAKARPSPQNSFRTAALEDPGEAR